MLIAEDLLLLLLDDETGKPDPAEVDKGLAGAVLIELAMLGRIAVADGRIALRPGPPPSHPALAAALDVLADKEGNKPKDVVGPLQKGIRTRVADALVDAGILRRDEHKVLGLFRTERLPAVDGTHEAGVRERVLIALDGADPDERTAAVIALLAALGAVSRVFPVADKRAATRRAKEIAEGDWAADAVRTTIEEIALAITVVVTVTAIVP